jgi:hypothetical protein
MRELQMSQDECIKGKAHIEQSGTELRAVRDDLEQMQRSRKVLDELLD